MFEHLDDLVTELERIEAGWTDLYAKGDQGEISKAGKRQKELEPVVEAYRAYRAAEHDIASAREMLKAESDPEMRAFVQSEIDEGTERLEAVEQQLKELLLPRDPNEGRNVIMEIQGTEGGEEANLWAGDLFRMYSRFAERNRWKLEVLSGQPSDQGGYREVTFMLKGDTAWARLKYEGGPH